MNEQKFLLVELTEPPRVWLSPELPNKSVALSDAVYFDSGCGDFLGFYDYLRNAEGEILGVRFAPFEEFGFDRQEIQVFFSDKHDFEETKSDDQVFVDNKLYKSKSGARLVTFRAPNEKFAANSNVLDINLAESLLEAA